MADAAAREIGIPPRAFQPRLRGRVALTYTSVVVAACVVAAALLFSKAANERHAIQHRALSTAVALSFAFDQEVAAVNYLLKGLSTSPALLSGDVKAFYDQMKVTPVPEGSWLVLQDLEGQVANTIRPFGTPLPKHTEVPGSQEQIARIRDRGWTVSGRIKGPVARSPIIGLSLRIDGPDGQMKQFITTILAEKRLTTILAEQIVPSEWAKAVYDRGFVPIVTERDLQRTLEIPAPKALRTHLAGAGANSTNEGTIEDVDERGVPILVAFRRSGATNWVTAVSVPLTIVNAPITGVMWQMAGPTALLLLAGGLAALFTARQVERPLRTLSHLVAEAESEVTQLSAQLLALQEEERQRIARELHDSTAQHLVATNLGLMRLATEIHHSPAAALKTCGEIGDLLDRALLELRVFTYLLHPPNLDGEGLQATLREFIDGFAARTALQAQVQLSDDLDDTPSEIQRAILRVVQEALANVHRHAGASRVHVGLKVVRDRLVVRIRDNGRGMTVAGGAGGRLRMGVGIPGMHARLRQFGGDLKLRSGPQGTSLLAYVPLLGRSKVVPLQKVPRLKVQSVGG